MEEPGGTPYHPKVELEYTDSDKFSGPTRLVYLLLRVGEKNYYSNTTVLFGKLSVQIIGRGVDDYCGEKNLEALKNNVVQ